MKMPSAIKINQQYTILADNDWPKIRLNHNIVLPITSTIPRGVRSLVIQVTDVKMQCQKTKFGPQVYSDEAEEPRNKPKYGDQINFIKTACNVLSSQEKQRGLDICNMEISGAAGREKRGS